MTDAPPELTKSQFYAARLQNLHSLSSHRNSASSSTHVYILNKLTLFPLSLKTFFTILQEIYQVLSVTYHILHNNNNSLKKSTMMMMMMMKIKERRLRPENSLDVFIFDYAPLPFTLTTLLLLLLLRFPLSKHFLNNADPCRRWWWFVDDSV